MTENLTESLAAWPWAAWLLLAGLAATVELFRRDGLGVVGLAGCLAAAVVAVVPRVGFGWQLLGFAVGAVAAAVLTSRRRRVAGVRDRVEA